MRRASSRRISLDAVGASTLLALNVTITEYEFYRFALPNLLHRGRAMLAPTASKVSAQLY